MMFPYTIAGEPRLILLSNMNIKYLLLPTPYITNCWLFIDVVISWPSDF